MAGRCCCRCDEHACACLHVRCAGALLRRLGGALLLLQLVQRPLHSAGQLSALPHAPMLCPPHTRSPSPKNLACPCTHPQVHDEVILEGPAESAEEAKARVVAAMANPWVNLGLMAEGTKPLRVDLVVDADTAPTWYEAK